MQSAIEHVIRTMWNRYDEPLSLEDLADTAVFSRFYFARAFRGITGTSPGRFLTAIRLYEAKHLLLETQTTVTDVSYQVGYNSPGTFSTRFTKSVGMSPARYRYQSRVGIAQPSAISRGARSACLSGRITVPDLSTQMRIYVGTFDSPIPQGMPSACSVLDEAGHYRLDSVPAGDWYVRAVAVAVEDLDPRPWMRRPLLVSASSPARVTGPHHARADLDLRPLQVTDLPVLLALPELDSELQPNRVRGQVG